MKHTKGPWTLNKDEVYGNNGRDFIADIFNESESYKANANLIASAPEMFEALQSVYCDCSNLYPHMDKCFMIKVQSILKKARGK